MSTESDGYVSFGVGLFFGISIGAILGVLFAPKPGNELRSDICNLAQEVPENVNNSLDETKEKCNSIVNRTRYSIENKISKVNSAIKAGKMASAKMQEGLEEDIGY